MHNFSLDRNKFKETIVIDFIKIMSARASNILRRASSPIV
jgi:hypothetical protein